MSQVENAVRILITNNTLAERAGSELYVQYALDDPFAPFGVALSNAVRGTVP